MTTKDFVADFSAPTDGSSSCASAISAWRTWIAAHPGDTLTIPAHTYNADFAHLIASSGAYPSGPSFPDGLLIPNCTIAGAVGTTFANWSAWGTYGQSPLFINNQLDSLGATRTGGAGAFIEACLAGATTITLLDIAEAASFVVGRWVAVCGICLSSLGYPPNFQQVEFRQITNVSGAVITLNSPLLKSYSSTWINSFPTENACTLGGAACVFRCGSNWDITQTVQNIHALTSDTGGGGNFSAQPLRSITCEGCTWEWQAPGASFSQSVTLNDCTQVNYLIEFDKMVETITVDGGHYKTFRLQGSTPGQMIIRNSCVLDIGFSDGTAKNMSIADSTITSLCNTGTGYGRCESLIITNSTVNGIAHAAHGPRDAIADGCFTYLGSGLWIFSSDNFVRAEEFQQCMVPGYQYAFAYADEIYPDPQFTVQAIYFCVTDISETTGPKVFNYHMQTDMTYGVSGGLPTGLPSTSTWLSHNWDNFFPIPYIDFTIDAVHQSSHWEATADCPALIDGDTTEPPVTALMPAGCM